MDDVVRTLTRVTGETITITVPAALLNRQVEVIVLPVEDVQDKLTLPPNGQALTTLYRQMIAEGGVQSIDDPMSWQKEQRQDRPLPGREMI